MIHIAALLAVTGTPLGGVVAAMGVPLIGIACGDLPGCLAPSLSVFRGDSSHLQVCVAAPDVDNARIFLSWILFHLYLPEQARDLQAACLLSLQF